MLRSAKRLLETSGSTRCSHLITRVRNESSVSESKGPPTGKPIPLACA